MTSRPNSTVPNSKIAGRKLLALLAALVALLAMAPVTGPAHAQPPLGYDLVPAGPGDPLQIPVLIYRHRHTILTPSGEDSVSWARNVAGFEWAEQQVTWIAVAANVSGRPNNSSIVHVDLFQRDQTGALRLVDTAGNPLLEPGGTPVDWRASPTSTLRWDLSTEPDPEVQADFRGGRMHSERVAYWFLKKHRPAAVDQVERGFSEKIPCNTLPSRCQQNLKSKWFSGLTVMKFQTDLESEAKLKRLGTAQAKVQLGNGEHSDAVIKKAFEQWRDKGMPAGPDAGARLGARLFNAPGTPAPEGVGAAILNEGADPGGIDFSTLELRYLSEDDDGRLSYAFNAMPGGTGQAADGQIAAAQMSDSFFVWLALPPSSFWVNLNPNEPDRIIDPELGKTDAGRILLEADLRMKTVIGRLLHPDTDTGRRFWDPEGLHPPACLNMRQWIVPKPASVREEGGGLHIVEAPLEVKMETDYLPGQGDTSCATPDKRMETVFREVILPGVEKAVNEGPEFADLRRVYLSRVAAEWYRHRGSGSLKDLVDSGDASRWPALQQWTPREVFDRYVESLKRKEFDIKRPETINGQQYEMTYSYGGVDMAEVPLDTIDESAFEQSHADLPDVVRDSFQGVTTDQRGRMWLGSASKPAARAIDYDGGNEPEDYPEGALPGESSTSTAGLVTMVLLALGLLAVVGVIIVRHLRATRRPLV